MRSRPQVLNAGFATGNYPGPALENKLISSLTTAGDGAVLAATVLGGILNRTGPGAGFADTFPTADDIVSMLDNPQVGDSWTFVYRNGVAQAMTYTTNTGLVAGIGTLNVAASKTRHYQFTVLSYKRTTIKICTTTNANAVLTNVRDVDIKDIMPGMGASGTGIGASAVVLGAANGATPDTSTITLSVNSTATANNIAVTFFPRIQIDSFGVMDN